MLRDDMSDSATIEKPQKQGRERQREALAPTMFKPGQSGNPGGKPVGTRNALNGEFLKDLQDMWRKGGRRILNRVAEDDPATIVRVVASLQPKEVEITKHFDELTDEQLDAAYHAVRAIISAQGATVGDRGQEKAQSTQELPPVCETT